MSNVKIPLSWNATLRCWKAAPDVSRKSFCLHLEGGLLHIKRQSVTSKKTSIVSNTAVRIQTLTKTGVVTPNSVKLLNHSPISKLLHNAEPTVVLNHKNLQHITMLSEERNTSEASSHSQCRI